MKKLRIYYEFFAALFLCLTTFVFGYNVGSGEELLFPKLPSILGIISAVFIWLKIREDKK